ncbi:MAG: acyl-CoA dehydrogenase [Desulfobacterales bacterium]|jgi:3-oxocholest-4-en-26-oyl-CoA dehydrogenase alpha subunit|nr:acyl-CoA dehydrogenase [Desulfobacteraceae bacterium]MBT7085317.1 acyl-CoA dehydrogenase [Desulfobacterales bacterium]MBT7698229.1 acyl-CoA dehydrogenase [Desulfobacterales bacterium]
MDYSFTPEEDAFRKEISDFLDKELPSEWFEKFRYTYWEEDDESWEITKSWNKKLGEKGYLGVGLPKEYGGLGGSHFHHVVFEEELYSRGRTPTWIEKNITVDWISPTLLEVGTEEQKEKFVKPAAKGDLVFCLGYSEPDSGSDLASMTTSAVEDGDEFIINGQKTWTTMAHRADYIWLAARTDPDAPPHKGITIFLIDMKTPGITVRPIINMLHSHSYNEVFFDNCRVPKSAIINQKNMGWYVMMVALNHERGGVNFPSHMKQLLGELVQYCKTIKRDGKYLSEDSVIRKKLAKLAVEIEVTTLLNYRTTCLQHKGKKITHEGSLAKILCNDMWTKLAQISTEILGPFVLLDRFSRRAPIHGDMARYFLNAASMGVGGGATEIQRNVVAQMGLGFKLK